MQSVKRMEKLLLGVFLPLNELDVVNQDQISRAIAITEGLHAVLTNRLNQIIGERFGGHVRHPSPRIDLEAVMANGLHQVGFSKTNATTNEQRIEFPPRGFCHCQSSGVGHAAVLTHHKATKHITGIQRWQIAALPTRACWG